jgi:hypothetical protein
MVRAVLIVGALALSAGAADARILGIGHKDEAPAAQAGDQVCTTSITVVRKGDKVLSTTSTTRCDGPAAAAASAVAATPAPGQLPLNAPVTPSVIPSAPEPYPSQAVVGGGGGARAQVAQAQAAPREVPLESQRGILKTLFGASDPGPKPRDFLGDWSALQDGAVHVCKLRLTREALAGGGYKVTSSGCEGTLAAAKVWKFETTEAGLYTGGGAPLLKLSGDRTRLTGVNAEGGRISLIR